MIFADVADRHGMTNQPHYLVGVKGGRDHTGIRLLFQQLLVYLSLTDDDAADVHLDGPADHVRLLAADDDAVRL